ncbi:MAG: FadR/GntR family transcriptional regulator [Anaerolineae bacterium]
MSQSLSQSPTLPALSRDRLVDRVIEAIKDYIVANDLRDDSRLPSETELSQSLDVSRNVVRQAISALEVIGLLRTEHGRGTFVAEPGSSSNLFENLSLWLDLDNLDNHSYYEIRLGLEYGIFHLVIENASDDDLDELDRITTKMVGASGDELDSYHRQYHKALLDATGNYFLASVGMLLYHYMFWLYANAPSVGRVPKADSATVHRRLTQGLRRRDPSLIPYLIAVHIGYNDLDKSWTNQETL